MPAYNPFVGDVLLPANPQLTGGATPMSASESAEGLIGAVADNDPSNRLVPVTLSVMVLLSVGVIIVAHMLGVRAGVGATINVGGK